MKSNAYVTIDGIRLKVDDITVDNEPNQKNYAHVRFETTKQAILKLEGFHKTTLDMGVFAPTESLVKFEVVRVGRTGQSLKLQGRLRSEVLK